MQKDVNLTSLLLSVTEKENRNENVIAANMIHNHKPHSDLGVSHPSNKSIADLICLFQ